MKSDSRPWWMEPAAFLGAGLVTLLGRTWRIERVDMVEWDSRVRSGERCLFAFWHSRLLPLVFTHRRWGIAVLISQHRDGELIARIIEHLGFVTARGSSTRGGDEGARGMLRHAEQGRLLAVTPDGPRGPAERVKPGLVYLASRTGYPVVPVATSPTGFWPLRSWDRFRFPHPFTKVVVGYGAPISVPRDLDEDQVESWRVRIEEALNALTRELDRRAGVMR